MAWTVPALPRRSLESKVYYWQQLLEVPPGDPAAPMLREMAAQRLCELGALTAAQADTILGQDVAARP